MSSLQATSVNAPRAVPLYTASTVSKSLPAVSAETVALVVGVKRNQTVRPMPLVHAGTDSPVSTVAARVSSPVRVNGRPGTTAAAAKALLAATCAAAVREIERLPAAVAPPAASLPPTCT